MVFSTTPDRRARQEVMLALSTIKASAYSHDIRRRERSMVTFILWLLLLIFCWPLALLALILYPLVWLILLPFRLVGIAVEGVFAFLRALIMLPARVLGGGR
jgi:hypothetical protein